MIFISISEEAKQKRYESYRNKRKEKAQNYIGKKYNHWTIIKYNETITENNYMTGKPLGLFFDVQCDCKNKTIKTIRLNSLESGHSKSCGCIKFNNSNTVKDLTGKTFGRLTVIRRDLERDEELHRQGKKGTHWLCQCNCGNPNLVSATVYNLKSGHTQSCGCYASEQIAKKNKIYSSKNNPYIDNNDGTFTLLDDNENECIIDKEDYDILKRWYWRKIPKRGNIEKGYWTTNVKDDDKYNTSTIFIHQIISEIKYGEYDHKLLSPDHLSRNTDDNRKCNLYLKSNQRNSHNRGLSKRNTSGKTGVSFNEEKGLWTSYITVNYKRTWLGDYDNIDDAIKARKETEEKYNFTCDDIVAPYDEEAF